MKRLASLALLALAATSAHAQDEAEQLETITVVGSRITYRDLLETPAISLTRQGDYLLQGITLYNDTRNEELRHQELYATIKKMLDRSAAQYDIVYGANYVGALNASNYKVELQTDKSRPDANHVELSVRAALGADAKGGERLIRTMREFVESSEKVGRTEIELAGETGLSMKKPERYRYELIEAIAADTAKVRERLGTGCTVSLDGLNSRIEWERVSATELLLYIPYTMTIADCGMQP